MSWPSLLSSRTCLIADTAIWKQTEENESQWGFKRCQETKLRDYKQVSTAILEEQGLKLRLIDKQVLLRSWVQDAAA
jgi:hypothetical protein